MFGFRGRFGRRRSNSNRPSAIDEAWLRKLAGVLPGDSVARVSCEQVSDTFALLASGRDANGTPWLAAVSPRSGLDAALAVAVAAGRGACDAGAVLYAASPDWTGAARRLAAQVRAADGRAIAQAAVAADGDAPEDETPVFVPAELLAAGLASAEARATFERAAEGLRGLAAKHGGALRSANGELELVVAASAIAALRAEGEPSLEIRWPDRSRHALGGSQLADALDRLEGQVRKRLGERDARDGEDGMRARLSRAFAASEARRFAALWPFGGAAEPVDAVGVADDGAVVVLAARERVGLIEVAAVMQASAALEPVLPHLTRDVAPPVRVLESPRVLLAGLNLLPAAEDAARLVGSALTLVRASAIEGPFTPIAASAPPAAAAKPAPAPVFAPPANVPSAAPLATAPAAAAAPAGAAPFVSGAPAPEGDRDENGEEGRGGRRRRRRGRRRGRGDRPFGDERDAQGGDSFEASDGDDFAGDDGAPEESAPVAAAPAEAPASGGFETLSLLDLDDDAGFGGEEAPAGDGAEDGRDGRRRRRRGRGGRSRRGGDGERSEGEDEEEPAGAARVAASEDEDDHAELPELAEAPELSAVDVPRYEDEEEEPESELDRIRHERERRRRERAASGEGSAAPVDDAGAAAPAEQRGLPRGRVAIVAHADRESIAAAVLLAREMRQLEGIWIYPQEDLMTFFRGVATDLREDTPIYLLGFAARPARDALQAASLYQGRLVWFDHHEWPPEDLGALKGSLGDFAFVHPGGGSVLPLVLPHCGRRSRFSDKLVDLVTGRFTAHDFQRWGRLWWWRLGQLAAKKGERRAELNLLIEGRPSDLAREAERCDVPAPPSEVEWAAARDFRMVHFAGIAMVIAEVPAELDLHMSLRIARERFGALLGLGRHEGESTFVLTAEDSAGRRPVDVAGMAAHLAEKFSWVEALPDDDHVARFHVKNLASDPARLEALIAEIGMGRSILEG
ncbi:MAG: hypothetical protein FJ091_12445 [Deltaproteobacteria bacterium]|nr:hypothetical protein [Deltaproteobacteria bacterium]